VLTAWAVNTTHVAKEYVSVVIVVEAAFAKDNVALFALLHGLGWNTLADGTLK